METLALGLQTASALTTSAQRAVERRWSAQRGGVRSNGWLGCVRRFDSLIVWAAAFKASALLAHGFVRRAVLAW